MDEKKKWTETTWRVVADYAFDDSMGYVSVATGFLSGGFSETCSQVATCLPYDPETNIPTTRLATKADLFDDRLRLNVAAFYTEFDDLQRNQVFAFTNFDGSPGQETITLNAGKSNSLGVEVETTWLATDRLQIRVRSGTWTRRTTSSSSIPIRTTLLRRGSFRPRYSVLAEVAGWPGGLL